MNKMDYKFAIMDLGEQGPITETTMEEFEIWIGYYHMGQGSDPPAEPEMVAKEKASTFEVACLKHELRSKLKWLDKEDDGKRYISTQDKEWFYDWRRNRNSWTGQYYPSRELALESFLHIK